MTDPEDAIRAHLRRRGIEQRLDKLLRQGARLHFTTQAAQTTAWLADASLLAALADWGNMGSPATAGEPWGTVRHDEWTPSLQAALRLGTPKRGVVELRDVAQQPFLYGHEIGLWGIHRHDPSLRPGDIAWVCDQDGDVLGLASFAEPRTENAPMLKPLVDLGWYLREGG